MTDDSDKILDAEQWKNEAKAIICDIKCHVRKIGVSTKLGSQNSCIHLNITTLEGLKFCVEASTLGFTVIGNDHDIVETRDNEKFETPYALLEAISPEYRNSFGNELTKKLVELAKKQQS